MTMIELLTDWFNGRGDLGEIEHPTRRAADGSSHVDLRVKRMPVQPRAFMPGRNIGEPMCSLEGEFFEDVHAGQIIVDWAGVSNANILNGASYRPLNTPFLCDLLE